MCTVTTPVNGSVLFEGEVLSIAANATDNASVSRVLFTATEGDLSMEAPTPPFSVPFVVPVGVSAITFNATAYDGWGNTGAAPARFP